MGIIGASKTTSSSKLVGWLVTYAGAEMGKSYEIRVGRSIISNKSGDNPLLLINTSDVNAPHAALKASLDHKVMLQDIFSDYGTFVTNLAGSEIQVTSPVQLEHGDWLRIGERARFQVCLIDGGRK